MTIHLPEDLESSIRAEVARGRFASADEAVAEAVRSYFHTGPGGGADDKPIWEQIREVMADVPEEAWNDLPSDLAAQHDHYVYGTPKQPNP